MKKILSIKNRGQSLIELLVVMGLMAILLPVITTSLIVSREGKPQQEKRARAAQIIQEYHEAIRSIRESGWSNIETNGNYHIELNNTTWELISGQETLDGISRQISISDTQRDSDNKIVESGGTIDPSTKKITTTLSWNTPIETSVNSTIYLTRYLDNATYVQTTKSDFDSGILNSVVVTNTSGGEITLGSGGFGSWCEPELTIAALNLPKSGVANAVTAIEGRAFATTGENASGVSLADIHIDNSNPPSASIRGTFDGYKTNDVFGESNYAYIATDHNSKEIVIVNLSSSPYAEIGSVNLPGSNDAISVFVVGSIGYATSGNKVYSFDLSSKSGIRPLLDPDGVLVTTSGTAGKLYVVGNFVYTTIYGNSLRELAIINATNAANLQVAGWADVNGENGRDVFVNQTGTRAFLATGLSSSKNEFFIINIESKNDSRPIISSYNSNGTNPNGIAVTTGNKAILVGDGGEEYQIIDFSNENAPYKCGGINIDSGIKDISSVLESDGDTYSYIVTGDVDLEFKIISGGSYGAYSSSGVYESSTFDIGYAVAFNRIIPTSTKPLNTEVKFQVAIADSVSGNCSNASFDFFGPDGTSGTYYTNEEGIFFSNDNLGYENPARCMRYKAYLETSDSSATPILEQMLINYSP